MKLGILVTTDKHLEAVTGLTRAALKKGHDVSIFSMDDGSRLLAEPAFADLSTEDKVEMGFCEHNAKGMGLSIENLPEKIISGSQYDNAVMNHEADKVIVL